MPDSRTIDTGTDHLLARVEDRVATLTLNRPERRNALSGEMIDALAAALDHVERASDVGCVLLTGAGQGFCSGGDVKGMAARRSDSPDQPGPGLDAIIARQRLQQRNTAGRIYQMPKPVIAALPGAAAGAGLSLALACDVRIAAESAILTTAFAKVGFSGDYGGTFFLTQLVGSAKARELYYFSDKLTAKDAERLGLVNRVVASAALQEEALGWARRIAHGPSVAYRYMKENLNRAVGGELGECLDLEATHHVHTGLTEDHRAAVRAFVAKQTPVFAGR